VTADGEITENSFGRKGIINWGRYFLKWPWAGIGNGWIADLGLGREVVTGGNEKRGRWAPFGLNYFYGVVKRVYCAWTPETFAGALSFTVTCRVWDTLWPWPSETVAVAVYVSLLE